MSWLRINPAKSWPGFEWGGNGGFGDTLPAVFTLLLSASAAWAAYGGGSGTAGDPYLIATAEQMQAVGADPCDWDKHFKLTADIDLSAYTGESFNVIGYSVVGPGDIPFTGVFDGNGHTISNFTYSSAEKDRLGLFGYVDDPNAEIKNLGLIDPNADAGTGDAVGALCGTIRRGSVSSCFVRGGSVRGEYWIGGLIGVFAGSISSGSIIDCNTSCVVDGNSSVGGLIGLYGGVSPTSTPSVSISYCYATGNISGLTSIGGLLGQANGPISDSFATGSVSSSGGVGIGGLVGIKGDFLPHLSTITNCYATGNIVGTNYLGGLVGINSGAILYSYSTTVSINSESGHTIGGLAGANTGSYSGGDDPNSLIYHCYAIADVTGSGSLGGLVGNNYKGTISECYSLGDVTGSYPLGGLVAKNNSGSITNCYATGNVSGSNWNGVAGLVGRNKDNGSISKCYSTGHVSEGLIANNVGGLVGENETGSTVSNSFWDKQTSGHTDSAGGTGKTTAEMQTMSTFTDAGWDFIDESANGTDDIWRLCVDLTDYPRFVWQKILLGDFYCPDGGDALDLAFFLERWLPDDCNGLNGYCDGADLNRGGEVDGKDYGLFAKYWSGELTALVLDEDFETGDFSKYDWQHSGATGWVVVSDVKYEGSYSAKSGAISDSEQSVLEVSVNTGIGSVSFYCKVSSEADEDYLRFYIDDELQNGWSGEQDWALQEYAITSGPHTLKWSYEKDTSMSAGSDCAWIDKITVIGAMP
jgi:hypothetical protein